MVHIHVWFVDAEDVYLYVIYLEVGDERSGMGAALACKSSVNYVYIYRWKEIN